MLQGNGFRLITLGRLTLLRPDGTEESSLVTRRRKLAVLTLLALSNRPLTRDRLATLFWGEQDDERARHSLADTLSHLRRVLGKDAITLRQEEIALSPAAPLAVDVREFRAALAARDTIGAAATYGGPFLDGVYVDRSPEFDDWASRERETLAREFAAAARDACARDAAAGNEGVRAETALRWLAAEPLSDEAAVHLIEARASAGTPESLATAVGEFDRLAAALKRDYGLGPGPRSTALAADLRQKLSAAAPPRPTPVPAAGVAVQGKSPAARARPWQLALAGAAVLLALAAAAMIWRGSAEPHARPVIAVAQVRGTTTGGKSDWLADGLPQMIAADLSRSSAVDVVAPERIRELRLRAARTDDPLAPDALADLGHRLGADWVVTGALSAGDTSLALELDLVDAGHARLRRVIALQGRDPFALANAAAARLLEFLNATGPGPHLAAAETSNLEAYQHYVASERAAQEGRFDVAQAEVDQAIALDSGFISAVASRLAMARGTEDWATADRLQEVFERYASRASDWDRATEAFERSLMAGERVRSEALGRQLVAQFPKDPRAYSLLAEAYTNHGHWDAADTVLQRELALDSLALEAGTGPCAPCVGYGGLVAVRVTRGDLAGAEKAAFRWVGLQPELPAAWDALATTLSYEGKFPDALASAERALALAGNQPQYQDRVARTMLMGRRYPAVDSALARWRLSRDQGLLDAAADIGALSLRERGTYAAAETSMDRSLRLRPEIGTGLTFLRADNLIRMGRPQDGAAKLAEIIGLQAGHPLDGGEARAEAWHWALKAAALFAANDTLALAAIADSIDRVAQRSYYGRDWGLPGAVRGMIASTAGRWPEAVADFQGSRWGISGWNEVNVWLARAYLAEHHADSAVTVLRQAYAAPLDAMGRYQPRSEIDYELARAFLAAGRQDSAAAYVTRLKDAWSDADPGPKERLAELEREVGR